MIILPDTLWSRLLDEFRWPRKSVERVAYFDGVSAGTDAIITTLTFPNAQLEKSHFRVPPEAMSECGAHFRKFGMVRVAQVHTHPGDWVDHSPYDNQMAYSQHRGAISIVLPKHARKRPQLKDCGLHIRSVSSWERIPPEKADDVIHQIPGLLDFRRKR